MIQLSIRVVPIIRTLFCWIRCTSSNAVTNATAFEFLHDMMRRSDHRLKDVVNRRLLPWDVTGTPTSTTRIHHATELRNYGMFAHPDTFNVPMRKFLCSSFVQQRSRIASPLQFYTHLRESKPKDTIFRWHHNMYNWICSVATVQERRDIFRFYPPCRNFSSYNDGTRSKSRRQQNYELSGKRNATDPFVTLGILRSPTLTYTSVKSTFLKIAMKYHPDTTVQCTDAERETNKDLFVSARKAFESIMANPDGFAILKIEADDYVEEEDDFEEWFKMETGYDMPFMDAATMKEVAEMTDTVGGGLDRDGGMWTLARMVANTVKEGGDTKSVLQLDAGIIRDRAIDGVLRRRRRR